MYEDSRDLLNPRKSSAAKSGLVEKFHQTDIFKVSATRLSKDDLFNNEGDFGAKIERLGGVSGLLAKVQSEANTGIMGDEADLHRRKTMFGSNDKPRPQLPPFKDSLVDALNDRILLLVGCFAILSIITGMIYEPKTGWREGLFILVALLIQVLITAVNDYSKDTQFVKLQSISRDESLPVIRGKAGSMQTLNIWEMVVGDVVHLKMGDKAPADCVVISSVNCIVDEAHITGDNNCSKTAEEGIYADSYILSGEAHVLVCAVGAHSTRGVEDQLVDTREQVTELSKKLSKIEGSLRFVGLISAFAIFVLSLIILFITVAGIDGATFAKKFVDNLTLALIVLIVAIPEGIPMTIGISLAYSVIAMYEKDSLIVRDLTAPEQLGLIDEIALGKTGTMTTEDMNVVSFYIQNQNHMNSRKDSLHNCHILEEILEKVHESVVWNSSAYIEMTENSFYIPIGNGTEVSLLKWLQNAEVPVHELMQEKSNNVLFTLPFDSNLKRSVVAVRHPKMESTVRVYIKGAPETVVPNCQYHYRETGAKEPFDSDAQEYVMNDTMIEKMAKKGHRCMAFSYADINEDEFTQMMESTSNFTEEGSISQLDYNQTFLALIALHDPLRAKIKDTLAYATLSGLNIRLISGDNLETCRALACDVGILTKEQYNTVVPADQSKYALEARDFRETVGGLATSEDEEGNTVHSVVHQDRFEEIMQDLKVIARATPADKLLLTVGLQGMNGNKVAIIGEGINDIPAFKQADVSFAMGSGSSIARNNASIVLASDEFESVMRAIMWGRNIYLNMQRFLTFQMTCSFACLATVAIGYCFLTESPLNAVQLIWINLIMDILGALALSATRPTTEDAKNPIVNDKIMHTHNYRAIYGNSIWMIAMMSVVIFGGKAIFGLEYDRAVQTTCVDDECGGKAMAEAKMEHFTLIFNTFVFLQFWNMLNAKEVNPKRLNPFTKLFSNWLLLVIMLVMFLVQASTCFLWIGVVFEATPLSESRDFTVGIVIGATVLLSAIIFKYIPLRLFEKFPVLNEEKSLGGDSKLMAFYDAQAQAKVVTKKSNQTADAEPAANDDGFQNLDV